MSLKILDTVTLSLLERTDLNVLRRFLAVPRSEVAVTVINVEEQFAGWQSYLRRAGTPRELALAYEKLTATVRVLSGMQILTFPESAITRYNTLLAMKLNVGKMDLRISAIRAGRGRDCDYAQSPRFPANAWAGLRELGRLDTIIRNKKYGSH